MAEDSPARFRMHGARQAIAVGMTHIEQQVEGIERSVSENPGLSFDLAKTLIESVCRTILTERGISFGPNDDTPTLFRSATRCLPFLPAEASTASEVRTSLAQTLNGLNTAAQGICKLRNTCGFASHGSGGPRPTMERVQAILAAQAADAIVGFLYSVHRHDLLEVRLPRLNYDDYGEFNAFVDEMCEPTRIFEEEFIPSRILFEMGPEPYRVYLTDFLAGREAEDGDTAKDNAMGGQ